MLEILHQDQERLCLRADSESDTRQFGECLASALTAGDVVALSGDLGAGKTRLVKGIASGLDVADDEVNSPTFTLIQEYSGRVTIRHCDTYRLRDPDEFLDLGLDELFSSDGIALVEWADRVEHLLPRDVLFIRIEITSPESRQFWVEPRGKRSRETWLRIVEALRRTNA